MTYITIAGIKYERELIDLAEKPFFGVSEGKISKDEAVELIASAKDGAQVTDIEKATLVYIRKTYPFTDAAAGYFDCELASI